MTEVTTFVQLEEPEIKQEEMKEWSPLLSPPPALKSSIKFTAPVIKKTRKCMKMMRLRASKNHETKVAISRKPCER